MARTAIALIGGIVLGALASIAVLQLQNDQSAPAGTTFRDIGAAPSMDQAVADQHRHNSYAEIDSINEIVALPTQFARTSAMHSVAGRLDSAGLQTLIYETNRISDEHERGRLLEPLFFRFAELDPQSALVLSRNDSFSGSPELERVVWRAWGRKDLDDALFAARTQTTLARQKFAAQSLYAAFGDLENSTVERIEAELGIKPDRRTRGRFLYRLADRSIDEAIAFINANERSTERTEYTSWLAHHLALRAPDEGLAHADKFVVKADGERFRSILKGYIARDNPRATIESYLASGMSIQVPADVNSALRELAANDIGAAKDYFGQLRSREHRMMVGPTIASTLAESDPEGALAWAREQDSETSQYLVATIMAQVAGSDPERAFSLASEIEDARERSLSVGYVVQQVARQDPSAAAAFVEQITNEAYRRDATRTLVISWMSTDADAAVDWILTRDEESANRLLQESASQLVMSDVDAAIRVLPKLDDSQQANVRQQIARRLALSRSPQEAQAFVRQFEGQSGFDQLQASMISGLAETDVTAARQLADQLGPGSTRDSAYLQIVSTHSREDPSSASSWLQRIDDETMRAGAAGQLATHWYMRDPQAATQWVNSLPRGTTRDTAIMRMSAQWRSPTPAQHALIASIENRQMRGQTKIRQAYNLMRSNPEKARELLSDEDIPAELREQAEALIKQRSLYR